MELSMPPSRSTPPSRRRMAWNEPVAVNCARKASAGASGTCSDGISACSAEVQLVFAQAMRTKLAGLTESATLPTITPMAPAFLAFCTLTVKPQVPRLMKAILPVRVDVMALQPSTGVTATTLPLRLNDDAPNCATPTPYRAAMADGVSTSRAWKVMASKMYICIVGRLPSDGVDMFALLR